MKRILWVILIIAAITACSKKVPLDKDQFTSLLIESFGWEEIRLDETSGCNFGYLGFVHGGYLSFFNRKDGARY